MIRFSDAMTLAYTKLRVHRIRTGITVIIAGLLFGLVSMAIIVATGVFKSIDSFSEEGLNNRTVLVVGGGEFSTSFMLYKNLSNQEFIKEVETEHAAITAKKTAAAKKYGIEYTAKTDDPLPIEVNPKTKQKFIPTHQMQNRFVTAAAEKRYTAEHKEFDIDAVLSRYPSAKKVQELTTIYALNGELQYMKDGKEKREGEVAEGALPAFSNDGQDPMLAQLDSSLAAPFMSNATFDPSKGEVPVILPFSDAEKLLGLKKLSDSVSSNEKLQRLREVRETVHKATASFCYRNGASQGLLARAVSQAQDKKDNGDKQGYQAPKVQYSVPPAESCGAVEVVADKRTAAEKRQDDAMQAYEKEIGTYSGEPVQKKIIVRGVGISSDQPDMESSWSISAMMKSMFSSALGYNTWAIPSGPMSQVPKQYLPDEVFAPISKDDHLKANRGMGGSSTYLVELASEEEGRALLKYASSTARPDGNSEVSAYPFGSSVILVDEMKTTLYKILAWAALIIGIIAIIILGSIVARTVAEGRRESAVFRAIGAKRGDIGAIYSAFTVLLSLRIALFALAVGIVGALVVELLFWKEATVGAQLAYAAADTSREFHLFSLASPYLLGVIAVILAAGLIASLLPIALGARRNPIRDMRDDT